jgi:hypothetical protein
MGRSIGLLVTCAASGGDFSGFDVRNNLAIWLLGPLESLSDPPSWKSAPGTPAPHRQARRAPDACYARHLEAENFVSLIYYFGLLSFAGEREGRPLLKIPNRTVRQLMYSYLRAGYHEAGVFRASTYQIANRLNRMAYRGEWRGFFDYLAEEIARQASVRDFLQGEKMIQGFLLAWLHLSPYFRVFSESEQAGGFVDLYLAPFFFHYPDMRHAYLIELKYLSRNKDSEARRAQVLEDARAQLRRYADDPRVTSTRGEAEVHKILLLYSGWELVHCEAVAVRDPA